MPKGSVVEKVEKKLKKRYGSKSSVPYAIMNKIGLMHGNKPTAKGMQKARTVLS